MCRFLVYRGSDEILLSKLILDPTHSILKQSFDSRLRLDTRRGQNNADGFGIGFYTDPKLGPAPCLFTSTVPAWNCANLQRIASKTASRLVFAHVRATTEGSLSEDNCHPFTYGSLIWMHNGGLGGWKHIKRRLGERLADKWYLYPTGGTDSEWAFALLLDTLERMGHDPASTPEKGFGPTVLRKAMLKTIAQINELTDAVPESVIQAEGVDTRSLLNFAVADGHSVICTRYISSSTDEAASLYYSSGTRWETRTRCPTDRDYMMERQDKGADIVLVASEPLTFERENWVNVPTNSILTIHKQTVMVHPIVDQYYSRSPYHVRSSAYVQAKGLNSNEKRGSTPAAAAGGTAAPSVSSPAGRPFSHHHLDHLAAPAVLKPRLAPKIPVLKCTLMSPTSPTSPESATAATTATGAAAGEMHHHHQLHTVSHPPFLPQQVASLHQSTSPSGRGSPSDIRSTITLTPPSQPMTNKPLAAQGNIKVKRRSLGQPDAGAGGGAGAGTLSLDTATAGGAMNNGGQVGGALAAGGGGGGAGDAATPDTPGGMAASSSMRQSGATGGDPNKIAQFFPELRPLP